VVFPYWENSVTAAEKFAANRKANTLIRGIEIVDVTVLLKDRAAWGLEVVYRVSAGGKEYRCAALFASRGDGVSRSL
jgi:hypothetical protein